MSFLPEHDLIARSLPRGGVATQVRRGFHVSTTSRLTCILAWAVISWPEFCGGQTIGLESGHDPWGRFDPGAWKVVRVVTESFDPQGTETSTTETRTSLLEIGENSLTLRMEVVVDVEGTRFRADPKTIEQGFHGEPLVPDMTIERLDDATLTVQDRQILCRVRRLTYSTARAKTVTEVYFSTSVEPFVLRRKTVKTDLESGEVLSQTTVEVVEMNVPRRVLGRTRNTHYIKRVHKHPKGTVTTAAFFCNDVPGGLVCQTLKELDNEERLIRRSSLELIDYGLRPNKRRAPLFSRRHRARKPFRFTPYPARVGRR